MASHLEHSRTSYKCLRLPADGGSIERLDYNTVPTSSIPTGLDSYFDIAADLRGYWEGDYGDRLVQTFCVGENSLPTLDGEYVLYYSTDINQPVNKTILGMPALQAAVEKSTREGERFEDRLFYRGDMFVVRLSDWWEKDFVSKHEDISPALQKPLLALLDDGLFAHNWKDKFLEYQKGMNEDMAKSTKKHKELCSTMLSSLSPEEQQSPGVKDSIDLIAAMCLLGAEK